MSLLNRTPLIGQARQRELLKSATSFPYSETPEGPLHGHFFAPPGFEPGDKRPLVLFLHGGLWDSAMATQFVPHCLYFAERGAVWTPSELHKRDTANPFPQRGYSTPPR